MSVNYDAFRFLRPPIARPASIGIGQNLALSRIIGEIRRIAELCYFFSVGKQFRHIDCVHRRARHASNCPNRCKIAQCFGLTLSARHFGTDQIAESSGKFVFRALHS